MAYDVAVQKERKKAAKAYDVAVKKPTEPEIAAQAYENEPVSIPPQPSEMCTKAISLSSFLTKLFGQQH